MKKFFTDFKAFITRGNILDLAVGLIIGSAFTAIVKSLVNDLLMPIIGLLGGKSIGEWKYVFKPAVIEGGVVVTAEHALYYGNFIQAVIDFVLIAFVLFLIIRVLMKLNEAKENLKARTLKEAEAPVPVPVEEPAPSAEIVLLTEIRDALKKDQK
ncbi:MAG TPA: large conductance mechanosensitive channel protein MscL [Bacilli bacterium]|nr:large conductance mechanosensitive channel protein MscL [Bacilli bacterium]